MDKLRIPSLGVCQKSRCTSGGVLLDCRVWELVDSAPDIGSGQVHLWVVDRLRYSIQAPIWTDQVSREERQRAEAYHFQRDRERFLIARTALRDLLARYLGILPIEVPLALEPGGKLQLASPNTASLFFNITHSDRFTLIAVTREAAIGVDLEAVDPSPGRLELARHILSEQELLAFEALPSSQQLDRFYQLWTMKEAILKAFGTGFRQEPRELEIGIALSPVDVRNIVIEGEDYHLWTLIQLPVIEGYRAALAVEGAGWSLACWSWDKQLHGWSNLPGKNPTNCD